MKGLKEMKMDGWPALFPVRQKFSQQQIENVSAHVQQEIEALVLEEVIQPGMCVAVGVGSRGISCIAEVVTTVVHILQAIGAEPFLVPAMGSHGGGTAEGQRNVLISYGLGPDDLGIPIKSNMDALQIGTAETGMPVYFDRNAAQADAILVINRIKPHTAFRNRWESGLFKMLAIGFGKRKGAETIHGWNVRDAMPVAAKFIIDKMPVVAGVGIVENGYHQPVHIRAIAADKLEEEEPKLLEQAWEHLLRMPLEPLDLLILEEIGKDISGTGMDVNVVGMWRRTGGPISPHFHSIAALDLTPNSHGNATGVGYADFITQTLHDKIDIEATYTNCITAGNFNGAKIPITLPSVCDILQAAIPEHRHPNARFVIARNTLDLERFWVSEPLLADVNNMPALEVAGAAIPLRFTAEGELDLTSEK